MFSSPHIVLTLGVALCAASSFNPTRASAQRQVGVAVLDEVGALDTGFSGDGKQNLAVPGCSTPTVNAIASSGGQVIVVGNACNGQGYVMRLWSGGKPDPAFDGDGFMMLSSISPQAVIVGSNGDLLIAGSSSGGTRLIVMGGWGPVRINVTTNFASLTGEVATSIAVQANGRIVVAGYGNDSTGYPVMIAARYLTSGALDTAYDGDGKVIVDFASSLMEVAQGVVIDSNNQAVIGGSALLASNLETQFAAVRLTPYGQLDTAFDGDGKVLVGFAGHSGAISMGVDVDSQDRVVLGGYVSDLFALVRLTELGAPDAAFGTGGRVITDFLNSSDEYATAVAIQANDKIVAAGTGTISGRKVLASSRYNVDGSPDKSYNGSGRVYVDFTNMPDEQGQALTLDNHERVMIAAQLYPKGL